MDNPKEFSDRNLTSPVAYFDHDLMGMFAAIRVSNDGRASDAQEETARYGEGKIIWVKVNGIHIYLGVLFDNGRIREHRAQAWEVSDAVKD